MSTKNKLLSGSLDLPAAEFAALLDQCRDIVLEKFSTMVTDKAFSGLTPLEIRSWLEEELPTASSDPEEVLAVTKEKVVKTATMNMGPNMYAYVMAGGTQISILAELLASTINQNVGKWHLAPVISEMEQLVVKWAAQFIGYEPNAAGVLVSGGSAANLTALTVARNITFEAEGVRERGLFAMAPLAVYCSTETHSCVDKSVDMLGIGANQLRKISVTDDFTIDLQQLELQIEADKENGIRPFCVIGNAGTVNTGAIDPLGALASIAKKYDMWFHVDGAYGALAASVHEKRPSYEGMQQADSIALDFHKWLYQPFEAGCVLVKSWSSFKKTYYKKASYLSSDISADERVDFNEYQFQLSRNAKALKIWMSFKVYGADLLRQMIAKDLSLTRHLADQVQSATDFSLKSNATLGVVCFTYLGRGGHDQETIDRLNTQIIPALELDGRVFITGTQLQGHPVIRACLINHRLQKENVDFLLKVIREVGTKTESSL